MFRWEEIMKKILLCLLCGVLLFGVTGCGSNEPKYTENMEEMRNITIGYLENNHLGELLDKAIEDASWEEDEKYSSTSGAIIVTGKDKNTKDSVELIWLTSPESGENGFESLKIDGTNKSYSEFLEYLKEYTSSSSSSNNNESESSNSSNYEAEDVLTEVFNSAIKTYEDTLTYKQLYDALQEKNYTLRANTGDKLFKDEIMFDGNGAKLYLLVEDNNDNIYSFYATYQDGKVTITQFKQER